MPRFKGFKMRIELLDEVSSTNEYIKNYLGGGEDVIVCARRQSGGKGTKGRSFLSGEGGVYFSALAFYSGIPAAQAFRVMTHAAVAVCRTAEKFGAVPEIKWPNDIHCGGRKLCGILIENKIEDGELKNSIVGIGLNVCNDLAALNGIAVNLSDCAGREISVDDARDALIENWYRASSFDDYLSRVKFLGREITVTEGAQTYPAVALRILPDGRLEVQCGAEVRALSSAEISIKFGDKA